MEWIRIDLLSLRYLEDSICKKEARWKKLKNGLYVLAALKKSVISSTGDRVGFILIKYDALQKKHFSKRLEILVMLWLSNELTLVYEGLR